MLTIKNGGGASSTPFIYTTNTTLHIHDDAFSGLQNGTGDTQTVPVVDSLSSLVGHHHYAEVIGRSGDLPELYLRVSQIAARCWTTAKVRFFDRLQLALQNFVRVWRRESQE
jgi:hypothetical protein